MIFVERVCAGRGSPRMLRVEPERAWEDALLVFVPVTRGGYLDMLCARLGGFVECLVPLGEVANPVGALREAEGLVAVDQMLLAAWVVHAIDGF